MYVPIPILLAIEFLQHGENDVMKHQLRVGVVGVAEPMTADIESDFYEWARIEHDYAGDGMDLPIHLRHLLLFKCFNLLTAIQGDHDIAHYLIPDATRWFQTQFLATEAEVLINECRRHVTAGLSIDPSFCSPWRTVSLNELKKGQTDA